MGMDVTITAPAGLPEAREPVAGYAYSRGNIANAITELGRGFDRLDRLDPETAAAALTLLIEELDRGEKGHFDTAWYMECDRSWSGGREFRQHATDHARVLSFFQKNSAPGETVPTAESLFASSRRETMRSDAFRFVCYYRLGYTVEWSY